ncbi:MAG: Na+/H+ antiporter subunit A, partial [Bhargavaea sp.]
MFAVFVIFLPFIMALFLPAVHRLIGDRLIGWYVMAVPLVLFATLVRLIPRIADGEVIDVSYAWIPEAGIDLAVRVDGLGMIFALLITGVGTLVALYSIYYL